MLEILPLMKEVKWSFCTGEVSAYRITAVHNGHTLVYHIKSERNGWLVKYYEILQRHIIYGEEKILEENIPKEDDKPVICLQFLELWID